MKGLVLYKGPSNIGDSDIVVILTLNSANRKTGNMAQTWILAQDISPVEALKAKADESVCGVCPLRQSIGGSCYVNVGQAPLSVWRAWRRGQYADHTIENSWHDTALLKALLRFKKVRFGAYGDPAAAPTHIWSVLAECAQGYTGYTHQLAHKSFDPALSKYCMISADTREQAISIHEKSNEYGDMRNARTFRVITKDAPLLENEIVCPSSEGIECRDCLLCDGSNSKQPNIAIEVHGPGSKKHNSKYSKANLIKTVEV